MTITYSLAPNPKWYIADLTGKPLGAGYMAAFHSLNKTQQKLVYEDIDGVNPWPTQTIPNIGNQGILFDENGAQGPFYFSVDSNNLTDTYYLEIYDSNGILQWTIDDFFPPGAGGGGGDVTINNGLSNMIANNVFYNHGPNIGSLSTFNRLSPDNHTGFTDTTSNAGPDAIFFKSNSSGTDSIAFNTFSLGDAPLSGDTTPVNYLQYTCTVAGSSEVQKNVQFPLMSDVQSLSGQTVTILIWALGISNTQTLTLKIRQFFGDGAGATADVYTTFSMLLLTNQWALYKATGVIPTVATTPPTVIGGCGNTGTFLEVGLPLNATCSVAFVKPAIYLGNVTVQPDFQTYDDIESLVSKPRTGDIRISLNSFQPFGWVLANDGTIGNSSSNATARANIDTFPLFNLLWNSVGATYAPMFDSTGTPVSYGVSSIVDFNANHAISLTKQLGRSIGGVGTPSSGTNTGTNWALGQTTGNELVTILQANLPDHRHINPPTGSFVTNGLANNAYQADGGNVQGQIANYTGSMDAITNSAMNIQNPVVYQNIFFKL